MRDFIIMLIAIGSVCLLIPFPGLIWLSLAVLAALWFVTPSWQQRLQASPRDGAKPAREREH